ncbi:MAG: DUF1801 domain-containing protein [Chloroflexota bacterium]
MNQTNPKVDDYLNNIAQWQAELKQLRAIVLECPLTEEWKWRQPCYTFQQGNVVIISPFKEYCSLNFFKGSLMKDPHDLLVAPGENSQASRQIRFTSVDEIVEMAPTLKAYIENAIEVEKAGLKVEFKSKAEYDVPEELEEEFAEDPDFYEAFESLTPGRQKGYLLYFSGAKQPQTRKARIEKYKSRIFDGKGMQDCVCGHSKRYPQCDGSHNNISE